MVAGIGASGILGVAFETTPGIYVAPTKYIPLINETMSYKQATVWRRVIRGIVDLNGAVGGNSHVEGDITIEALEDCVLFFLHASRNTVVKTGTPNFTYTYTPTHGIGVAASRTLSITIVRNGIVFAYTGCQVGSMEFTTEDGLLQSKFTIMGFDEAVQSAPTPAYPTTVPFGAGQYDIQVPTAAAVFDTDQFTLSIEDNVEAQHRLRADRRSPSYLKYGEREVELTLERDFDSRTEYDAFKALTSQSITILASKGTNNQIQFKLPVAIKDTYEVGLSGQGDLVRASIPYKGVYDPSTSKSYEIIVKSQQDIT